MTTSLFLEYNFAPIFGLIFQIMILLCFHNFSKKEKYVFIATLILEILEITSYNIEYYYAELPYRTIWRYIYSVIGYITRPALVYPFVVLLRDEKHPILKKLKYFDLIPLVFVIIIEQFAYFTKWVFWFDENNIFHRGPLGYISQVITILYMVVAIFEVFISKRNSKKIYVSLVSVVILYVGSAMIVESITSIRSLGISSAVYSIIFFMFTLLANNLNEARSKLKVLSEIDSLTQISNRYYGEKIINELLARKVPGTFAILDIDKFKNINDTYGHTSGDEAICKVAKVLKDNSNKDDIIMRLGGDEFALYSTTILDDKEMVEIINKFFDGFNNIQLSNVKDYRIEVSIGMVKFDGTNFKDFNEIYRKADNNLYLAKKHPGNYYVI